MEGKNMAPVSPKCSIAWESFTPYNYVDLVAKTKQPTYWLWSRGYVPWTVVQKVNEWSREQAQWL